MEGQLWERVQALMDYARQASKEDLALLLDSRCGDDAELRREVESLLQASDTADDYFDGLMGRVVDAVDSGRSHGWLVPGQLVARFRVGEQLGSGGMGDVFRATDLTLERDVALKVLSATVADDPKQAARLKREARLLAALSHPSIAAIHGLEEVDGRSVLVLELVEGPTLAERLEGGPLPVSEVVSIGEQIAGALEAAHRAGIVHRDLKPTNVKFTSDDRVKVLDFGIAKALEPLGIANPLLTGAKSVTQTDVGAPPIGTVPYMSPEQLASASLGTMTDLWALGVVLFEALAGQRPFRGEYPAATIVSILEEEPDWSLLPLAAPAPLVSLVRRCLRKDSAGRLASAAEARHVLEALLSGSAAQGYQAAVAKSPPATTSSPQLKQEIRFCTADDGVRIAYATVGSGPTLVKAANWLNHLEYDWDSPVWRHLFRALASKYQLIRYDERGNGLSDWDVEDISFSAFVRDLETVIDATGPERFALLGISQGCAVSIAYSVAHPERVSHLILVGGYALGASVRGSKEDAEAAEAMATVMRFGWGHDNPAFRQLFTSRMIPGASREQMDWFNELQRMTASPETAQRLRLVFNHIDVRSLLPAVRVPTLVMHARGDATVPFKQGRLLASEIPGARFCPLESDNHLILEDEPAWPRFLDEIHRFLADEA